MHGLRARLAVVAVLAAIAAGAGAVAWDAEQRVSALAGAEGEILARLDGISDAVGSIAAAQQAYVVAGHAEETRFARTAPLMQALADDTAAARPRSRSAEAAGALDRIAEQTTALASLDSRIRERLRLGDDAAAADALLALLAQARATTDDMTATVGALRGAERRAFAADRGALTTRAWTAVAGAAGLWLGGLLLLARVPQPPAAAPPLVVPAAADGTDDKGALPDLASARPSMDLGAAADLCVAIARMTATVELPDLLARTAAILDASGVIVWMSAGEELFAVAAHGYDARAISRLGPIGRNAENATAACWRTGEVQTVAGDVMSNGAIVAPMFGPDACIGVLAAEVRHGREADPTTDAVTVMIAAQLATAVSAWPAASRAADHMSRQPVPRAPAHG